ncbi:MAG: type II toxin-antitoxin system HicA family toxin [Candidatus Nanoarchaeia archaeon]|nr:type II toxin-antitoxin system HicA family toxin [Candidatus Nanoarchaeia archaeon]
MSKRIEDMIRTKQLGDVSRSDMLRFFRDDGYYEAGGKGGHTKLVRDAPVHNVIVLPSGKILRKDQVRYILKEGHYL